MGSFRGVEGVSFAGRGTREEKHHRRRRHLLCESNVAEDGKICRRLFRQTRRTETERRRTGGRRPSKRGCVKSPLEHCAIGKLPRTQPGDSFRERVARTRERERESADFGTFNSICHPEMTAAVEEEEDEEEGEISSFSLLY